MLLLLLIMFFILAVYIYKKREKPMLKIILCFIGYIILSIGIAEFPNIHEKGMSIFISLIYLTSTIILILSGLLLILYVVFESKIKSTSSIKERFKYMNGYTMSVVTIALAFIGFSLNNHAETRQGESLGFTANMDFSEAKRHNIYNVDEYSKFLVDKKAKEETELASQAEKDRIAAIEQEKKDKISQYDCTLTYLGVIPGSKESWQTPAILTVTNNDFSISFIDPEDGGDGLVRSQPLGGTICDDENICTRKGESEDTQESKVSKTKIRSILKISDSLTAMNMLTSLDTMMITHAVNECNKKQ